MENKKTVLPIAPDDAYNKKLDALDPEIIQAVNELIIENIDEYKTARIKQDEIVDRYLLLKGATDSSSKSVLRNSLFDRKQLDFEDVFRKNGWSVTYDKPGYNETYDALFIFKKKKKVVDSED